MSKIVFTEKEELAEVRGIAMSLALGLKALQWLDLHAMSTGYADFGAPERCQPCCGFAAALLRGQTPNEAEHLRCKESRNRLHLAREAYGLVPGVLGEVAEADNG